MGLLLIDIGRGTQDILLYRPEIGWENSLQLVLPAPTVLLAGQAEAASARGEDLLFTGETMGGGPLTEAVRRHLASGGRAWATPPAAATFDDDPGEVAAMGVTVLGEDEAAALSREKGVATLTTGDVDLPGLQGAMESLGVPFSVGAAAVAVQDHGRAPKGTGDRRFRFQNFRESLEKNGCLRDQAHTGGALPPHLTRMQGVKRSLEGLEPLLLMDTGFAALLGTLEDAAVSEAETKLILNIGNGHTLAGLLDGEQVVGLLEHHTAKLDGGSLARWMDRLVDGAVTDDEVYGSGGHGAYLREGAAFPGWDGIDVCAVTGPQRALAEALPGPPLRAAPHGQMMLTGNYGLYRAFEARWGAYGR